MAVLPISQPFVGGGGGGGEARHSSLQCVGLHMHVHRNAKKVVFLEWIQTGRITIRGQKVPTFFSLFLLKLNPACKG